MKIDNTNIVSEAKKINSALYQGTVSPQSNSAVKNSTIDSDKRFSDILNNEMGRSVKLQFSKHANMRLNSRDIDLTQEQLKRIEDGVRKADLKGVRDSLVLVDNVALVINVRSNTVITAVNSGQTDKNVFTNIDGAVIV